MSRSEEDILLGRSSAPIMRGMKGSHFYKEIEQALAEGLRDITESSLYALLSLSGNSLGDWQEAAVCREFCGGSADTVIIARQSRVRPLS